MNEIEQQIENTLDKLRPFIQRDGGDVEFDSFDKDSGTVYVKMKGACAGCMYIDQTLSSGIEVILCEEVPGVNAVKVVEEGLSM
ncbi:MAG TPA: NifU family protein [Firmicutes bacterium]|jgi:nifU-like protein|nr:nifU-like protein [Clostridium sp. CAG:288]HAR48183.1 NifU family protein [Bacillota bacterium]HAW99994.1 NifU family protein [Bacillota bacterium]HCY68144.1 NifU family protein [Bacillota bacterium]